MTDDLADKPIVAAICVLVCIYLAGCGGQQTLTTGGDSPITSNRMMGTRLIDINEAVSWKFESSVVVIENDGGPIPTDVVNAVLPNEMTCHRIEAEWQLDEPAGLLVLSRISVDGASVDQEATIRIKPAGHVRVNLDARQYNMFREKPKT